MVRGGLTKITRRIDREALAGEGGFSLIELLVVVIIVGMLAAIAIPNFLLEQSKAHDAHAKTAARSAQLALEDYSADHGSYSGATPGDLAAIEPQLVDAQLTLTTPTGNSYRLESAAPQSATFVVRRETDGSTERTCFPIGQGGCKDGHW